MVRCTYQIFFFTFLFCFFATISHAQTSAPQLINFQGVLVDEGGNVLYEIQEADVRFSIVDGAGEILYEEIQHVPIINGAISVLVGNGNDPSTGAVTSGIPYDVFTAEGSKILRVRLEEHPIPQEDVQIVSVPYAYQAQYAVDIIDPIESSEILDRTIQQIDLSEELLSYIESSITGVSEADLLAHRTESGAHTATSISVENTFVNASGSNLQQILQGLDAAVGIRRNQDGVIIENLGDEISARETADTTERVAREAADTFETAAREGADEAERIARETADVAETTARETADEDVLRSEVSRAGDTIYGDLTFYEDETLTTETMNLSPLTGDITSLGELSLLDRLVRVERDAATGEAVLVIEHSSGVERFRFDTETQELFVDGNIRVTGTVDGIDIDTAIADLQSTDAAEAEARRAADAAEQAAREAAVAAEEAARSAADAEEAATRAEDDTAEVDTRETADATLQSNIDAEVAAREVADSAERVAREAADNELQRQIFSNDDDINILNSSLSSHAGDEDAHHARLHALSHRIGGDDELTGTLSVDIIGNADTVDGFHLNQDVGMTASPTFEGLTMGGDVIIDVPAGDPSYLLRKNDSGATDRYWGVGLTGVGFGHRLTFFQDRNGAYPWDNEWLVVRRDNGHVGIGTTDPRYELDVDGTVRATEFIYSSPQIITIPGNAFRGHPDWPISSQPFFGYAQADRESAVYSAFYPLSLPVGRAITSIRCRVYQGVGYQNQSLRLYRKRYNAADNGSAETVVESPTFNGTHQYHDYVISGINIILEDGYYYWLSIGVEGPVPYDSDRDRIIYASITYTYR